MSLINVAIVAVDGFSPFHYSIPCILFGDSVSGEKRFNVTICAETPGFLTSKDGFALNATQDYTAIGQADIVVVPYWQHVLNGRLRRCSTARCWRETTARKLSACVWGRLCWLGGILDGKRASTHWEFEHHFQSLFPNVQLDINALYVDDGNIITSAGTAAALDCCLYIIRQRFGSVVANQIARRMIVPPHREGGQAQFIAQPVPKDTRDARINCLIDYLQQHITEPHSLDSLVLRELRGRGELAAHAIASVLYPEVKDLSKLSEDQKQTVITLASVSAGMAGGLAGGSTASAAAGAQGGKNAAENNATSNWGGLVPPATQQDASLAFDLGGKVYLPTKLTRLLKTLILVHQ